MKKFKYTKLIASVIACACLFSACGEDSESTTKAEKKRSETEITSAVIEDDAKDTEKKSDAVTDNKGGKENSEKGSDKNTDNASENASENAPKKAQDKSADDQKNNATPLKDEPAKEPFDSIVTDDTASEAKDPFTDKGENTPATAAITLGAGNLANGGFATGDDQFVYYVTHLEDGRLTITQENRSSGEKNVIRTTSYSPNKTIDSLSVSDNVLYFRESGGDDMSDVTYAIIKLDLASRESEAIYSGKISNVIVDGDSIYFSDDGAIKKIGTKNYDATELFKAEHSAITANIVFCIANNKIYYSDAANFATGGMFYGKIYSMDLDGQNKTVISSDVEAKNEDLFFSDGKALYFYGNTEKDGAGYFTMKLDGSSLDMISKAAPYSRNISENADVVCNSDELYVGKNSSDHQLLYTGKIDSAKIVIVGDDIYFMVRDDSGSKLTLKRMTISGQNETVLG